MSKAEFEIQMPENERFQGCIYNLLKKEVVNGGGELLDPSPEFASREVVAPGSDRAYVCPRGCWIATDFRGDYSRSSCAESDEPQEHTYHSPR